MKKVKVLKEYKNIKKGMLVQIRGLDWDTTDEERSEKESEKIKKKLPKDLDIILDDEEIIDLMGEKINDILDKEYGFCHNGYGFTYKSYYKK